MHVEDINSKEQMLREILLWASDVKQKSIDLQTKYVLEFSEEIDKDIPCTCNEIAYSIHNISCVASELIEECKDARIYMKDEHRIVIGTL